MSTVPVRFYTPEEYLERERKAAYKSQYYRGEIYAMSGASREHNLIVSNLVRVVGNKLLDRPCEVYPSDMRVKVQPSGLYTYPDVIIVCGKPEFEDRHGDTLLNPLVLFEVISPSTEAYDRGAKSKQYRQLASLQELVLVASESLHVERYHRSDDGEWRLWESTDRAAALPLNSIGVEISLAEIYRLVEFPLPTETAAE